MNWLDYKDFDDYCRRTGLEKHEAIKSVLENINNLSDELNKQQE